MARIEIKVKPQARASSLTPPEPGEKLWHAQLKSPPVDGKANAELIGLVAKHFGCRKADVGIRLGGTGRTKLVDIKD